MYKSTACKHVHMLDCLQAVKHVFSPMAQTMLTPINTHRHAFSLPETHHFLEFAQFPIKACMVKCVSSEWCSVATETEMGAVE